MDKVKIYFRDHKEWDAYGEKKESGNKKAVVRIQGIMDMTVIHEKSFNTDICALIYYTYCSILLIGNNVVNVSVYNNKCRDNYSNAI